MKKFLTIAAACVALVACNEKFIETPVNDGFGYLDINLSTNDDIVVSTKAVETNNFILSLTGSTSWTKTYSEYLSDDSNKKVLLGTGYTLAAENVTKEAAATGSGQIHYYGISDPFNVVAGTPTPVTVSCSVVNSAVTVAFDSSFDTYFETGYSVQISKDDRTFDTAGETPTLTAGHIDANKIFYNISSNAGENKLTCTITAIKKGESTPKTYNTSYTLEKAKWHQLTFKASSEYGELGVITINVDETLTDDAQNIPIDPLNPSAE
ncbi:MAG: DUF4493 domain-containing protein [Candidatus Cryptobacteroides sp.]